MCLDQLKPRDEAIEKIESYIIKCNLKPDDKLPSERTMCEMWDYNRSTLRSAIKQLILEGKIYNINGSGTYVARGKLVRNLQDVYGFHKAAGLKGRKVDTRVICLDICETSKVIGRKLKLPLGHKLIRLIRLRFLDDIPVIISTIYMDAQRFKGLEDMDLTEVSFYDVLRDCFGVEVSGGKEKLSLAYCDETEAGYLGIQAGTPVICQSGVTMDQKEQVFEYFKEITRSEYVCFGSELTRR